MGGNDRGQLAGVRRRVVDDQDLGGRVGRGQATNGAQQPIELRSPAADGNHHADRVPRRALRRARGRQRSRQPRRHQPASEQPVPGLIADRVSGQPLVQRGRLRLRQPDDAERRTALGRAHPVVVVDDGSRDPEAVAKAAARHGARLTERQVTGGPAAAGNSGLQVVTDADVIVFLDSDCVAPSGWIDALLPHFADPAVAAVAPRLVPLPASRSSSLTRYAAVRSPLDLGPAEAPVHPGTRVSYVPTAALAVRTEALADLWFDESLRYGEDVDLVWRLVDAGWQVRYDPAVLVRHAEPQTWQAFLGRRYPYGTSAGPLSRRHPARLSPVLLQPWPTAFVALLLARRPVAAGFVGAAATVELGRRLRAAGAPPSSAAPMTVDAVAATTLGVGRAVTQLALPAAMVAAAALPGRRAGRLATLAALVVTPALRDWLARRPHLDPVRCTLASMADDMAYGAGVWRGALSTRSFTPLLPRPARRRRSASPSIRS
jgi:mycofactocin glycosyltransferase